MSPTPIPFRGWPPAGGLSPLRPEQARALAERLPITPFFVLSYAGLFRGLDRAFVSGPASDPDAVIVQHRICPTEPVYFGRDPDAGWALLSRLSGWDCLVGASEDMNRFAEIFRREVSVPFRAVGDLHYTLERPALPHADPSVRLLGPADIPLLQRTADTLPVGGYSTYEELLTEGVVAGAVHAGGLVALSVAGLSNPRYSDIGVDTFEPYRRRGLSSAATYLVARELQSRGQVPVWSTGSHNVASQRVAAKVGFQPYGRLEYLVFDGLKPAGYRPR